MVKVNILLSTFNGEKYLSQLLDSIKSQDYKNIDIWIRDDGSVDMTWSILQSFSANQRNVNLIRGDNVGVINSYIKLINMICDQSSFCAFCDQDDIWHRSKITRAVNMLMAQPDPSECLYCAKQEYMDGNLNHLGYSSEPRALNFNNAIVENIAVGCTVVFGSKIRNYLQNINSDGIMMHDWWAYLISTAFGKVIYDPYPVIKYRQHPHSVTAWEPGLVKIKVRIKGLIRRLFERKHSGLDSLNQAVKFINTYPELADEKRQLVEQLLMLRSGKRFFDRIRYVIKPRVYRNDKIENFGLKVMILLGLH